MASTPLGSLGSGLNEADGSLEAVPDPAARSCALNWPNRGRNLSQSMMWASISGPSMQACLRTILPSMVTGTMQAPHMPVASTMIEFRLATRVHAVRLGEVADRRASSAAGRSSTTSATLRPLPAAAASSSSSSGPVTKPCTPNVPSLVV